MSDLQSYMPYAGAAFAGLFAGGCLFATVVDGPAMIELAEKNEVVAKQYFSNWWPRGRNIMMPLIFGSLVTHGASYVLTNDRSWLASGAIIGSFIPFTMIAISPHIAALRETESKDTVSHMKSFVQLHNIRTVVSIAALGLTMKLVAQRHQ